jgi:hypothetical protein
MTARLYCSLNLAPVRPGSGKADNLLMEKEEEDGNNKNKNKDED